MRVGIHLRKLAIQEPEGAENNYVKVTRPYNRHHQFPDDTKSRFFGDKKMTAKCNEISFFFRTSAFIERATLQVVSNNNRWSTACIDGREEN